MTERMTERIFVTIRKQTLFLTSLEELKCSHTNDFNQTASISSGVNEQPPVEDNPIISNLPKFPPLLKAALDDKDVQLKSLRKSRIRAMLTQVLFDHLSRVTLYPSHKQYVELVSTLVTNYPFMREKTGSGYDALLESLKNKFKKERLPLVNHGEIARMKQKYSVSGSGRKRKHKECEEVVIIRTQRQAVINEPSEEIGEDDRSIATHIAAIRTETEKARPNVELLVELMGKTFLYRKKCILEKSTAEVIQLFPSLRIPRMLLGDMKLMFDVDADGMIVTNLNKMALNIVMRASSSKLKDQCFQAVNDCIDDKERKGLQLSAAILLLPSLFREDESFLYVTEKIPEIPTPVVSIHNCSEGNPLKGDRCRIHMDGQQFLQDDGSVDISFALSAVFSLYYVFGIEYPAQLKKTLLFLERFVFKLNPNEPVPITLKRVFSSVCD